MSRFKQTKRRQRPVKGGRDPLPACVLHEIASEVASLANKYNCSKSFVIATALAETFGINVDEVYYRQSGVNRGANLHKKRA